MIEKWEIRQSETVENIMDFYRLQPGVRGEVVEKLETYLLLVSARYTEIMGLVDELEHQEVKSPLDSLCELLNGYLNSLGEEYEKIFEGMENPFVPIGEFAGPLTQYLPFVEALRVWNHRERDCYGVAEILNEFEDQVFSDDFKDEELWPFAKKLIDRINLKMVIHIEDLI